MARTCHGAAERDLLLCAKGLLRRARPAAGGPDPIVKILHRKKFAIQLIACHTVAMECYRRAMNSQLPARDYHLNQANKLSRTYATLLESLNKHRGKGQQKVTVEHVHVHQGGQAIVGHVEHKGEGGWRKNRGSTPCKDDERCWRVAEAKTTSDAGESPMRGEDSQGRALPIACHA